MFWLDTTADFNFIVKQYFIISDVFEYGTYANNIEV